MSSVLLPIQWGGLPQGYCFTTWNQFGLDSANAMKAVLASGMSFFNYGDSIPVPEYQGYPWLYTVDMRWYRYTGVWQSPNLADANERRIYMGALTGGAGTLEEYDGGKAGAITPTTGPMWTTDSDFVGRVPIGAGLIPGTTTPAITTAVGDPTGGSEHTLTEGEGAVGQHTHAFGITNAGGDDAFFAKSGVNTVANYTGFYITGNGPNLVLSETTADLFTLPSGLGGTGVTAPTPFQVIQPSRAVYIIKRTARQFYTVP